jgi:hypothetical protein
VTVLAARMRSQRLDGRLRDAASLVRHLGGVQAQEPRAAALSIRARTQGLTVSDVDRALVEERSIVRIWAMRGTIHLVAAEDVGWLHDLLAPRRAASQHAALDKLGVAPEERPRAVRAIVHAPLTRAELNEHLQRAGISTEGQRAAHLPALAALEGHVCFGPRRGPKDTYVLLDDWIGPRATLPRERALAELARRYIGAYAPAEPEDFAAWSGLPLRDARAAWTEVGAVRVPVPDPPLVRLLPAFDTYLLGYRDRSLAVPEEHARQVWPGGGIIRSTVVANGRAVGTWRLARGAVTVEPFAGEIDAAAEVADVVRFLNG